MYQKEHSQKKQLNPLYIIISDSNPAVSKKPRGLQTKGGQLRMYSCIDPQALVFTRDTVFQIRKKKKTIGLA